jgi:pyruvate-ferredoxin/flavodoxin oxidoreductase
LKAGKNPLSLDSKEPKLPVADYMNMETRFKMLFKTKPEIAKENYKQAQINVENRFKYYKYLADRKFGE